jgi:hypothetical protein
MYVVEVHKKLVHSVSHAISSASSTDAASVSRDMPKLGRVASPATRHTLQTTLDVASVSEDMRKLGCVAFLAVRRTCSTTLDVASVKWVMPKWARGALHVSRHTWPTSVVAFANADMPRSGRAAFLATSPS